MRTAGVAAVAAAAGRGPIVCVAVLAKKKIQNYKKPRITLFSLHCTSYKQHSRPKPAQTEYLI